MRRSNLASTESEAAAKTRPSRAKKTEPAKVDVDASHRRDIKLGYLVHDVSRMRRTAFDLIVIQERLVGLVYRSRYHFARTGRASTSTTGIW